MTASKTARLGLLNPVGSDAFVIADFATTMSILDANPGIPVVPNAAARPTNYTTIQHGSLVFQTDYGILWYWNQPTSGSTGFWARANSAGFLGSFTNTGTVATSTTNYAVGPTVVTGVVNVPGGRSILAMLSWDRCDNGYGLSVVSYWENNVRIYDKIIGGGGGYFSSPITNGSTFFSRNPAPVSSLALTVKITIAAYNAAPPNGGGTSTMGGVTLAVYET